jgi:cytochrome P450
MDRTARHVPGHPIFGVLSEFKNDRIGLLTRLPTEYGDAASIDIGFFFRALVVSSPELAYETLVGQSHLFKKSLGLTLFARPLLGNGLLASETEFHKRQRRMMAPAFVHRRIADYATTIGSYASKWALRLKQRDTADLSSEMMHLTFEIVGKTLFDADLSGDARDVGEALTAAMAHINYQVNSALPIPPMIPTPANLRAKSVVRRLDDVVYRLIRERRASNEDAGDFLSMLLLAQDEDDGSVMTDKQVRDEAMTIMLAGHETTANALAWTFYLLARNPAVRQKLQTEVDAVLGDEPPTLADLERLPFTLQVFKEAMRLYPPAYFVARRAREDLLLGGCSVKKNQTVIVDIVGMHRRARYFADPLRFDPGRFEPHAEKALPKYAYIPFGGGARICIGNHFALMEGQIVLAHLARHLEFDLLPESFHVEPEALITLRPKGGVQVRVMQREAVRAKAAVEARAV